MKRICLFILLVTVQFVSAEKKVTYGKSSFILYKSVENLEPLAPIGFPAPCKGYTLKQSGYGAGTHYSVAPGKTKECNYPSIYIEMRDWIYQKPTVIEKAIADKGWRKLTPKELKKLKRADKSSFDNVYAIDENKFISYEYKELAFSNNKEKYLTDFLVIEKIPATETERIMNIAWRFWNDGVHIADIAQLTQRNLKSKNIPMNSDVVPDYFTVTDILNLNKGFYTFKVENGKGVYMWHKYEPVFAANIAKKDFYCYGFACYDAPDASFTYGFEMSRLDNDVLVIYKVNSEFLAECMGGTWQETMIERKKNAQATKEALQKVNKANATQLELFYKEMFK
ncbi:MAG: hypothetical protein EOM76_05350 [Sphingobacteriia bacterium]|jgi:hypothetical protein|nr:hypothetical protein [Sphingobacteriia bacterium]